MRKIIENLEPSTEIRKRKQLKKLRRYLSPKITANSHSKNTWKADSMEHKYSPKGTVWVTTHRFVFQDETRMDRPDGLFEVPLEIFVKESYTGGMFQSGHRVKIKRDGGKEPVEYDSKTLDVMIQNVSNAVAEELKLDPNDIEAEYRANLSNRTLPDKVTLFCPSKSVRNHIKKCIDDSVSREDWTKVKFDINQHIRKSDIGIGNIMGRQKERDSVMSSKIAMTASDIKHLSSTAQELIDIANDIKRRLGKFKNNVGNYTEHTEIMDMIFDLGMNDDNDDIYVQQTKDSLSKKDFKKKNIKELVEFLDDNIDGYGGWIP